MNFRTSLFLFLLFCSFFSFSQIEFFKGIKAHSITIQGVRLRGVFSDPGFQSIQESARFGELFDEPGNYNWHGNWRERSFNLQMNFKLKDTTRFRHEYMAGIRKSNQRVLWLTNPDQSDIGYGGQSELMKVLVGYKFYAIKRKWIMLSVGTQLSGGFTVSSFTKEGLNGQRYEYFGRKQGQAGIEFPINFSFRFFKGSYLTFGPTYGFGYMTHDGTGQLIYTQGFTSGFNFRI